MPNDGGNLLLSAEEKSKLLQKEPEAEPYIRRFIGSDEFINNGERYCLWLKGVGPSTLKGLPLVLERIERVKNIRLASPRPTTRELANYPMLFGEIRQPESDYLAIPEVSSERRNYIPIGFVPKAVITSNKIYTLSKPSLFHFGVLSSAMHMAWTRTVCGRLKSDYQYSAGIVYNNFPWSEPTATQRKTIEDAAQTVLAARSKYPDFSLADLYDTLTMPPELVKAHHRLDAVVDAAYSKKKFSGDSDRVAFLFELYQQLASPLEAKKQQNRKKGRRLG
jgi:hypothetical protein